MDHQLFSSIQQNKFTTFKNKSSPKANENATGANTSKPFGQMWLLTSMIIQMSVFLYQQRFLLKNYIN